MMNYEQFQETVVNTLSERFPEIHVDIQDVSKLQGESYVGLAVRPEGSNIAATVNLRPFFEKVEKGMPMDAAIENIAQMVSEVTDTMPQYDVTQLTDYDRMKDTLVMQLIPEKGNEQKLAEIPHRKVDDMAIVYRFEMDSNETGSASILITNNMLPTYGITAEQLHEDAVKAAAINRPATLRNMNDVLRDMSGGLIPIPDDPAPIWVASVEGSMHGAAVVGYPDFMDDSAKRLGGDFFVLPSSIHELLFVPDDGNMQLQELETMVRDVNATEVQPEERLSDNVYHYDSKEHIFENAHAFQERQAAKEKEQEQEADEGKMTVLIVEPDKHPHIAEVGTELSALQAVVGGDIEVVYPFEDQVGIIVNEEGKINGLPLNRALRDEQGQIYDVLAGTFMVTGLTEDSFGSLTPEQTAKYSGLFHQPETFIKMGKNIMSIPLPEEKVEKATEKAGSEIGAKPKHKKPEHEGH